MAEQLAFHQRVCNGATVDTDKLSISAVTMLMNESCYKTFARTRFADEQNSTFGRSYRADFCKDFLHHQTLGLDQFHVIRLPKPVSQIVQFRLEDYGLIDGLGYMVNLLRINRISNIVARTHLNRLYRFPYHCLRRHHHNLHRRLQIAELFYNGFIFLIS